MPAPSPWHHPSRPASPVVSGAVRRGVAAALVLGAGHVPLALGAQQVDGAVSLRGSRGDYLFDAPVRTLTLSPTLTVHGERWRLSLTTPLVSQDSRAVTWIFGTPVPTGGPDHGAVARWGGGGRIGTGRGAGTRGPAAAASAADSTLVGATGDWATRVGDPWATASVSLLRDRGWLLEVAATGGVKAPVTELEDGVGSGAWDASVGASVALATGGWLLSMDAGWWWLGDLPELPLTDGPAGGIGLTRILPDRWAAALSVWAARSAIDAAADPASVALMLSRGTASAGRFGLGVSRGLTETTRGWSVWVGWGS